MTSPITHRPVRHDQAVRQLREDLVDAEHNAAACDKQDDQGEICPCRVRVVALKLALRALAGQHVTDAQRQRIDVEAMRANLHATFNGGHESRETIRAFHHGLDTVCNVLAAYQKGERTNGVIS